MPHKLVVATVRQDCNLNTLTDANKNAVQLDLRAGKRICYLVIDDPEMGDVKKGGRTGEVFVQGYFVTTDSMQENTFTVRFGRIGTQGQSQTKRFADEAQAKREAENLVTEKVKKGYVQKG